MFAAGYQYQQAFQLTHKDPSTDQRFDKLLAMLHPQLACLVNNNKQHFIMVIREALLA